MKDFERICSFEALYTAHLKARKRRAHYKEVINFELNLSHHLMQISNSLSNRNYKMGGYNHFKIYEPKERDIYATSHVDKIVMHVLCDEVLKPRLSRHFIYHNAACQKGKGTHFALNWMTQILTKMYRRHGTMFYVLKCDISKYFDSINHDVLKELLAKGMKDKDVSALLHHYIDSYHAPDKVGIGMPLGNQTSQWFGLYYLSGFDHFVKEILQAKYYMRYMDDFILVSPDKDYLWRCLQEMKNYLHERLKLTLNPKTDIFKASRGFEFLGWRFFVNRAGQVVRRLKTQSKKRVGKSFKAINYQYGNGEYQFTDVQHRVSSYKGHLKHGNTYYLTKKLMSKISLECVTPDVKK